MENPAHCIDTSRIKQDYLRSPAMKTQHDLDKLHQFFSPNRVPVGLTDAQLAVCIALHPLREKQKEEDFKRRGVDFSDPDVLSNIVRLGEREQLVPLSLPREMRSGDAQHHQMRIF
ncbi:MAG: hypothetical protein WDZ88_01120 [Candidatus Paceibacterota bacterium]